MKRILFSLLVLFSLTGCCAAKLDEKYVDTNDRFLKVIDLGVKYGSFNPTESEKASIEAQRVANAKARAVVDADKAEAK